MYLGDRSRHTQPKFVLPEREKIQIAMKVDENLIFNIVQKDGHLPKIINQQPGTDEQIDSSSSKFTPIIPLTEKELEKEEMAAFNKDLYSGYL